MENQEAKVAASKIWIQPRMVKAYPWKIAVQGIKDQSTQQEAAQEGRIRDSLSQKRFYRFDAFLKTCTCCLNSGW